MALFFVVIILLMFTAILILNPPNKDKNSFLLPCNISKYQLKYNILKEVGIYDGDPEIKRFIASTMPSPSNINNDRIRIYYYSDYHAIKGLRTDGIALVTIDYADGGSLGTYYDALIDSWNGNYFLLNAVISGSIFETSHEILDNGKEILCYKDTIIPKSDQDIHLPAIKNKGYYPIFLYKIHYDDILTKVTSVELDTDFTVKITDAIDQYINKRKNMNTIYKISCRGNKTMIYFNEIIDRGYKLKPKTIEHKLTIKNSDLRSSQ